MIEHQFYFSCPNNHISFSHQIEQASEACSICKIGPLTRIEPRTTASHSFFSDLDRCGRYSFYRHELQLRLNHENKEAMDAGTLWHVGMQTLHSSQHKEKTIQERLLLAIKEISKEAEKTKNFPMTKNDSKNRSLECLIENLYLYSKKYQFQLFEVLNSLDGKPLTEINFATLLDDSIIYRGIIDAVVNYQGKNYVVEYKSTSMLNSPMLEKYRIDSQITSYIGVAQELLGIKIDGAIVDILGLYGKVDPSRHLVRVFTTRTKKQLQDWKLQAIRKYQHFLWMRESKNWDQNTSACTMWNRTCEYLEPCLLWGTSIQKNILQSNYLIQERRELQERELRKDSAVLNFEE